MAFSLARRHPLVCFLLLAYGAWGYVLAAIASIQGSLYLLVLSVNSCVAVRRGLAERLASSRCGARWPS